MPPSPPTDSAARGNAHCGTQRADIDALYQTLRVSGARNVATAETHISWLLLAGDQVWKIKKPVRLPFVDFSTLAQRRHFCDEELRLNRRLAPDLYLDVQPLWRDASGRLSFAADASQPPAEWAVHMRRFADDALLRTQVERGAVGAADVQRLGERLARFHATLAGPQPPTARYGSAEQIRQEVQALFPPLHRSAFAAQVPQWQAWAEAQAEALQPFWQQRRADGWVREGHGDLHLGNLVLLQGSILPFDCLEFQPAMRWIDVVNDTAFLSMDLQAHGRADLAALLMDGWLQHSGDYAGLASWRFYEVYRALVRAMVAQLQASQQPEATSGACAPAGQRYARLLDAWTAPDAPRQSRLAITCGVSGSGKSTVATALVARHGAIRIRSDVERKRLFSLAPLDDSHQAGLNIYTPEASDRTFERLVGLADAALAAGWPVVVDAACLRRQQRTAFRTLAQQRQVPFTILHCDAEPQVLRERIAQRRASAQDPSEAPPELIDQQRQWLEPFDADELPFVHHIDAQAPEWQPLP